MVAIKKAIDFCLLTGSETGHVENFSAFARNSSLRFGAFGWRLKAISKKTMTIQRDYPGDGSLGALRRPETDAFYYSGDLVCRFSCRCHRCCVGLFVAVRY